PRRRLVTVLCSSLHHFACGGRWPPMVGIRARAVAPGLSVPGRAGLALAARGLALVLAGREPQRGPVRDQPRLVDVGDGHRERLAVDVERDLVAVDAGDGALQPAPPVLRQLQADLGLLAGEARELR